MAKNPRQYVRGFKSPKCDTTVMVDGDLNVNIDDQALAAAICDALEPKFDSIVTAVETLDLDTTEVVTALEEAAWVEISCPPCVLVDGVKAMFLTILHNPITGERKYVDATGQEVDPALIEIVTDPCDERCDCSPCADDSVGTDEVCCDCSTLEAKQNIANGLAEVFCQECGPGVDIPDIINWNCEECTPEKQANLAVTIGGKI